MKVRAGQSGREHSRQTQSLGAVRPALKMTGQGVAAVKRQGRRGSQQRWKWAASGVYGRKADEFAWSSGQRESPHGSRCKQPACAGGTAGALPEGLADARWSPTATVKSRGGWGPPWGRGSSAQARPLAVRLAPTLPSA